MPVSIISKCMVHLDWKAGNVDANLCINSLPALTMQLTLSVLFSSVPGIFTGSFKKFSEPPAESTWEPHCANF